MKEVKPFQASHFRVVSLVTLLALTSSCATLKLTPYETRPLATYANAQFKDGLGVAIQPITDGEESKTYFGTDLLSVNILPAFVISENHNSSSSFTLLKDNITLKAGLSTDLALPSKLRSEEDAEAVGWASVALISLPLAMLAGKMSSDASVINRNFKDQEFHNRTLSPGQMAQGFVYFKLPEATVLPEEWAIHLEALEAGSQDIQRFDFTFGSSKNQRGK